MYNYKELKFIKISKSGKNVGYLYVGKNVGNNFKIILFKIKIASKLVWGRKIVDKNSDLTDIVQEYYWYRIRILIYFRS